MISLRGLLARKFAEVLFDVLDFERAGVERVLLDQVLQSASILPPSRGRHRDPATSLSAHEPAEWSTWAASPANQIVLKQPKLRELTDAFDLLTRRVTEGSREPPDAPRSSSTTRATPTNRACCSADDRYSYRTLRDRSTRFLPTSASPCSTPARPARSRALKGGRARPPFLVDESADMRGHAFLTSSAETEAAQESDRIPLRTSRTPDLGIPRRRRPVGRREDHAERGVPVRLQRDARPDRRYARAARSIPPTTSTLGLRRRRDDRRPPDRPRRSCSAKSWKAGFSSAPPRRSSSSSCTSRAGGKWSWASNPAYEVRIERDKGRSSLARTSSTARAWCSIRSSSASRRPGSRRDGAGRARATRFEGETGSKCAADVAQGRQRRDHRHRRRRGSTRSADSATRGLSSVKILPSC